MSVVRPQTCSRAQSTELAKRRGHLVTKYGLVGLPNGGSLSPGSPGQAWGLQSWYSAASPTHGRPPLRGSGFVHVLLRTRKPSSQSREQDDHGPHAAQPPLTECGEVPPLRRRSSTRAGWGTGGETGLSEEHIPRPHSCPTGLPAPSKPRDPPPCSLSDSGLPQSRASALGLGGCGARRCTVGVAGSRAVRWAGSGLCPPPAKLQAVGVGQGRAAREAETLLLPRPTLSHVHRQPRCPRRVAPHFWAALRIAGLEFLGMGPGAVWWTCSPRPALRPRLPPPFPGGRSSAGPHHTTARAGVAVLTGPPPRLHAAPTVAAALVPGAP